jgi:hypothetical protein
MTLFFPILHPSPGLPPNKFKEVVKQSEPIRKAPESQLEAVFKCLEVSNPPPLNQSQLVPSSLIV